MLDSPVASHRNVPAVIANPEKPIVLKRPDQTAPQRDRSTFSSKQNADGTYTVTLSPSGEGLNGVRILRATANGKVIVKAGGGDDNARVDDATFTSDVKVNMGHGADTMNVGSAGAPTASTFGPKTTLAFGGGDDVLVIIAAPMIPAGGTFLINGGAGTDLSNPAPAVLDAITGVTVKSFEGLLV